MRRSQQDFQVTRPWTDSADAGPEDPDARWGGRLSWIQANEARIEALEQKLER